MGGLRFSAAHGRRVAAGRAHVFYRRGELVLRESGGGKSRGRLLGGHLSGDGFKCKFCFTMHSAYMRRGLAYEACAALMREKARDGRLEKFASGTAACNAPSVALLGKLGFERAAEQIAGFAADAEGRPNLQTAALNAARRCGAMKGVKEFYDATAAQWAEKWYADAGMLPLLKEFLAFLPDRPRVLDLCCGAGYESMRLAQLGAQAVGLDISPASVAIAREKNPALSFFVGDMLEDYRHVGAVDGIVCIAGLVHIPETGARQAFLRMAQVLNPGGYVLLVVREGAGRLEMQSRVQVDGEEYDRAFYGYTLDALKARAAGILEFVREIPEAGPSVWRNYVFRKPRPGFR